MFLCYVGKGHRVAVLNKQPDLQTSLKKAALSALL
jgi:hypothetical protein